MKDLFKSIVSEDKHSEMYKIVRDEKHHLPVKMMILDAFSTFEDIDGNFVEQFQTTGFDARLFELYVWMCLKESGFNIDRSHKYPDFIINKGNKKAAIEVTIATGGLTTDEKLYIGDYENDPISKRDINSEEFQHYIKNDVPLMFSSSILSKLQKKYWENEHCKGIPFVIGVGGFFDDVASMYTCGSLLSILFGIEHAYDRHGLPYGKFIDSHDKSGVKIPSGLFYMPTEEWEDMKYVSAIAFSNGGTISKFNRMGWYKGYYDSYDMVLRTGMRVNRKGPEPINFAYFLSKADKKEKWNDEVIIIHNPCALRPLPKKLFKDYSSVFFDKNGILQLSVPKSSLGIMGSFTSTVCATDIEIDEKDVVKITKAEFDRFRKRPRSTFGAIEVNWFKSLNEENVGVLYMTPGDSECFFFYKIFLKCRRDIYRCGIVSGRFDDENDAVREMVEGLQVL